jgi:type I restriction enzyme, S subunit
MIAGLKPYPEYKESGLPWLGKVPGHWEIRPTSGAFAPNHERNFGMKEKTVLSLSYGRIIIKPADKLHGLVPDSFETYQIVNPGDVVIRPTDLQNDHTSLRVGMVRDRGIITSAYLALRLKPGVSPQFGFQFLNAWDASKAIHGYGSGLRQNLDFSHFKRMPVALPPPEEQAAIARFLDWANGRLERAIRAKRKVIALLNEQKQAIIHRAVTRGLDPSVPLKPSGMPWLGDIPRHWRVWRLKFATEKIVDCLHATPKYSESGNYPAIRTADISPGIVHVAKAKRISARDHTTWTARLEPIEGDILYSREGERFGIAASVPAGVNLCISQRMMVFRIAREHNSNFVMWLLNCTSTYGQALQDVMGATAPHVNISTIRNYFLAMPAKQEQDLIVHYIDSETRPIDTTISRLEREIDLLREYRTRLVADVVTGKLDVREAAARLPDEAVPDVEEEYAALNDETEASDEEIGS